VLGFPVANFALDTLVAEPPFCRIAAMNGWMSWVTFLACDELAQSRVAPVTLQIR
jgi:hypothetical protein